MEGYRAVVKGLVDLGDATAMHVVWHGVDASGQDLLLKACKKFGVRRGRFMQ